MEKVGQETQEGFEYGLVCLSSSLDDVVVAEERPRIIILLISDVPSGQGTREGEFDTHALAMLPSRANPPK